MSKACRGFSMLELMIVLAIIAILAMVAIPNYKLYIDKAKFSEVAQAVIPYKTAVEVCAHLYGSGEKSGHCATPGHQGIPSNYKGNPSRGYVANIATSFQAPEVVITAESQRLSAAYNYILRGQIDALGEVNWYLDPQSTCLSAGLCHGD